MISEIKLKDVATDLYKALKRTLGFNVDKNQKYDYSTFKDLSKKVNKKYEQDKTYEFEFMINEDVSDIKDEIEDIFKYSTIISVKETTKKGLEQIQEPMFNK